MNKSIFLVDNHDSFTYNLVDLLRRFSLPITVCRVEDIDFRAVETHSHILISAGPDLPHAYPNLFRLLEMFQRKKTILGVCLGHQMLCQFFGAHLYNLGHVRHGQNGQLQLHGTSRFLTPTINHATIGLYHSWAVSKENFPPELQITAYCQQGIIMAVEHRSLPLFGVQFHPESFITTCGEMIFSRWLGDF